MKAGTNFHADQHRRIATAWAAQALTAKGCTLHAHHYGWDVEMPDGSWKVADNWHMLCDIAHEVSIK